MMPPGRAGGGAEWKRGQAQEEKEERGSNSGIQPLRQPSHSTLTFNPFNSLDKYVYRLL